MADKPINNAPEQSDAMHSVYVRKNNSTNDLTQVPANQFAHAVGLTAANRGRFFRVNSSGDAESVAAGTNGQVLAWNGSGDLVPTTLTSAALTQISRQVVSSAVASVVFTNLPSSGYSKFLLEGVNVVSANASSNDVINLHVSTDNGSTFKTTSGDYYTGTTAQALLTSAQVPAGTSTFQHGGFVIEIFGLGNSARATSAQMLWAYRGASVTQVTFVSGSSTTNGARVAAEADNALRLIPNSGANITSGTFILYGLTET